MRAGRPAVGPYLQSRKVRAGGVRCAGHGGGSATGRRGRCGRAVRGGGRRRGRTTLGGGVRLGAAAAAGRRRTAGAAVRGGPSGAPPSAGGLRGGGGPVAAALPLGLAHGPESGGAHEEAVGRGRGRGTDRRRHRLHGRAGSRTYSGGCPTARARPERGPGVSRGTGARSGGRRGCGEGPQGRTGGRRHRGGGRRHGGVGPWPGDGSASSPWWAAGSGSGGPRGSAGR